MTFIVLNPSEQLKKTRDSRRLADLKSLDKAIGIYESQTMSPSTGSSTKIYLSLPDTSTTCASYSLPPAPPGFTYACVTEANLRKTNGSGWVPIEFSSIAIGSPLSVLPVDPTNNNLYYYTYITGGSYQLTALSESTGNKVSDQAITDGGRMPGTFEIGTDLSLGPFTRDNGLVGYWTFDEASGTIAYDYSGNSGTGTLTNGPTWQTVSSCKRGGCLSFDGVDDNVSISSSVYALRNAVTLATWINPAGITGAKNMIRNFNAWDYRLYQNSSGLTMQVSLDDGNSGYHTVSSGITASTWQHVVGTFDGSRVKLFINGIQVKDDSASGSIQTPGSGVNIGVGGGEAFYGSIDDVRIYNRALSVDEIQAIYNATR